MMRGGKNSQNIWGNFCILRTKFCSSLFHSIQKRAGHYRRVSASLLYHTPEQPPLWLTKKDTPTFHRLQKVKHISQQKLRTSIRMSDFNYKSFLSKPWGETFKSISFASIKDRCNFIQVFSAFSVGTGCTRVLALHVPRRF